MALNAASRLVVSASSVNISRQSCVLSSTGCQWPSGFSSRLRLLHVTASVALVQPTSKTSAAQWSTPPVEQTSVRPIAVTCLSREPGHSLANEASVLLLQLSGTVFLSSSMLAIHQLRTVQSWVENPSLQPSLHQTLRTFVLRVNLFTYWNSLPGVVGELMHTLVICCGPALLLTDCLSITSQ